MSLKSIVDDLIKDANDQVDRAYRILGARPGPGIDLIFKPLSPVGSGWLATGKTNAGKAFVAKFWANQPIEYNEIGQLKREANDWGLRFEILWPIEGIDIPEIE